MDKERQVFEKVSELINKACDCLEFRIKELHPRETIAIDIPTAQQFAVSVFVERSISVYVRICRYIAKIIVDTDHDDAIFLLPHVRTLLDIYGKFVHLLEFCKDLRQKALTCIVDQLKTYKSIETEYSKAYAIHKAVIDDSGIIFPKTPDEMNNSWCRREGLSFRERKVLLSEEMVKKYSLYTREVFLPRDSYFLYSHFSEMLHGNPYYHNKPYNEKFWAASTIIITASYFIELIDTYFLERRSPRDFGHWLKEVKRSRNDFSVAWKARSV